MKKALIFLLAPLALAVLMSAGNADPVPIGGHSDYIGAASDTTDFEGNPGDRIIDKVTAKVYVFDGTGWYVERSDTLNVKTTIAPVTEDDTLNVKTTVTPVTKDDTLKVQATVTPVTKDDTLTVKTTDTPVTKDDTLKVKQVNDPLTAAIDTVTLTAPGYTPAIATAGYSEATFGVKVTNANTSVTVRFLGKITGLDWGSLDAEDDSTVIAGNKTMYFTYSFPAGLDSVKAEFHSEAGGTAATPTFIIRMSNPNPSHSMLIEETDWTPFLPVKTRDFAPDDLRVFKG